MKRKNKDLAVVCCFYNPCDYKSKLNNFISFYDSIKHQIDRVEVIELVYNQRQTQPLPEYVKSSKVYTDSILWHKENLLNIGIKKVISEGYENIAWIDADVLFENSFWVSDTIECLKRNNICQIFSIAEKIHSNHSTFHPSAVRYWKEVGNILPGSQPYHTGHAWAAKASILSHMPLYDKSITGGADSLIWLSCFASKYNFSEIISSHPIFRLKCKKYYLDFLTWAQEWSELIDAKIDHVFCNIKSLHHGDTKNKQYISRYSILSDSDYCPTNDLYYNDYEVLESKNKNICNKIEKYLYNRREDKESFFRKINNFLQDLENQQDDKNLENELKKKI